MTRAHKIKINPTPEQLAHFMRAAGIARFAWNWALDAYQAAKVNREIIDWNELKRKFRALTDTEFPFVREVTKCAAEQALADLRQAINTYYKVKKANPKSKLKFPGKRQRSRKIGGFGLTNDKFRLDGHLVRVPRLGWVNLAEALRFAGKILSGRLKEQAGHWYLIVTVQVGALAATSGEGAKASGSIGIDFGLARFATYSTGEVSETQAYFRKSEKKLKRLQRGLARKKRGSHNRAEWKQKVRRQHFRIANLRHDFQHKLSDKLTKSYKLLCVENLNLAGMSRSLKLGKSVHDAGLGEMVRQLEYKAEARGGAVQKVGRYFPSSKRCHVCDWVKADLQLSDRAWECGGCGAKHDRDVNAAVNIKIEGERLHAGSGYVGVTTVDELALAHCSGNA